MHWYVQCSCMNFCESNGWRWKYLYHLFTSNLWKWKSQIHRTVSVSLKTHSLNYVEITFQAISFNQHKTKEEALYMAKHLCTPDHHTHLTMFLKLLPQKLKLNNCRKCLCLLQCYSFSCLGGPNLFQHDSAPVHNASFMKTWFTKVEWKNSVLQRPRTQPQWTLNRNADCTPVFLTW